MDNERSSARSVHSLPDMAATLFSLILSLRTSSNYGSENDLRRKIAGYLDQIDKEGLEAGIAREDLEAVKYPLVAFIDETILNSEWKGRESWREHPLQLDLFGETVAGERFFERLDKVRRAGEGKAELLEIYYLCMALGFEGKYKIAGPAQAARAVDRRTPRALRRTHPALPPSRFLPMTAAIPVARPVPTADSLFGARERSRPGPSCFSSSFSIS